jgi:hypothetical protein
MARDNGKKVIYFTAKSIPTAAEQVEISALEADYREVAVRRADVPANLAAGQLEPADALAGSVPAAYKTGEGETVDTELYPDGQLTVGADDKPEALLILPSATPSIAANGGTIQLRLCRAERNMTTGAVTLTDITSTAAWTSGTPAKATVGASTGLVTGANDGAGSSVITATVTYDTNKTATATRTVTLT